jgi:NAD(P)-dependent dehydrogenase (short-subunit alcohol dehydrogenase family)
LADVDDVALRSAAEALESPQALAVTTDVSDPASVEDLRRRAEESFGRVDFLFNNAGISPPPGALVDYPLAGWRWAQDVNLFGVLNGIQTFVPAMLARGGGHVVNTASLLGITSGSHLGAYAASKAGVIAISLALREELAGSGVKVSVVFPHVASGISESRRNWPERLGADPWETLPASGDSRASEVAALTSDYVSAGMGPLEAADMIINGLQDDRFWIFATRAPESARAMLNRAWPEAREEP